jgi:parvulin-like peptidyl-prolyl isomerase
MKNISIRDSIFDIANTQNPCSGMAPVNDDGRVKVWEWPQISNFEFRIVRRWFLPAMMAVMLWTAPIWGEEIDRLIVSVNGTVITEGDLDLAAKLNELILYGKSAAPRSRTEEINRLIDLELLRQELTNFSLTQEDESKVEERMQSLRDIHADQGGLSALLARLGLQESELRSYLRLESFILKFVDFRFRPFSVVSVEEIKAYYEGKLAAQLKKAQVALPSLPQVSARIEEILKEDKMNASLDQWIGDIRRHSRIEYFQESESKSVE